MTNIKIDKNTAVVHGPTEAHVFDNFKEAIYFCRLKTDRELYIIETKTRLQFKRL